MKQTYKGISLCGIIYFKLNGIDAINAITKPVFQLGFQKGRVLALKRGTLTRCWIFKKALF
jgi:hypothetical protein